MTAGGKSDMGLTANAVLLLGYIAGALARDDRYEIVEAQPANGTSTIRHRLTGNLYAIAVMQLEGTE